MMSNSASNFRGLFITFEGGEGAGKSTLARRLQSVLNQDALSKSSREVILTREPGGTTFSEELRGVVLHRKGQISSKAELFLFLSARIQHVEELIKPALSRNAIVLCDRFNDSSIAYQGEARGLGMDYVSSCCSLATGALQPDLTFYIDIDPKLGLLRIHKRRTHTNVEIDRLENEALHFHEKVRTGFQKLAQANPQRIVTIDGSLSPDAIFTQALESIQKIL